MRIAYDSGYWSIPCLGGEGVNRQMDTLLLTKGARGLQTPCGESVTMTPDTDLMGWGGLDGPSYRVDDGTLREVNINRLMVDEWAAMHGIRLPLK